MSEKINESINEKIKVVVNGLPGKMAWAVAEAVCAADDMELLPFGLTGPEMPNRNFQIKCKQVEMFNLERRNLLCKYAKADIMVDFTIPDAINENVDFYIANKVPFVLGTTGGDTKSIIKRVQKSEINALIAPNMAKEIVAFQLAMEHMAKSCPDLFKGYNLNITESHQKTKADTSGTAKAMVAFFNQLGIPYNVSQINKLRSESDYQAIGVPEKHWGGHGYHTYSLLKNDGSVALSFTHNVNGRQAYIDGTLDAIRYLHKRRYEIGTVFDMIDVLNNH